MRSRRALRPAVALLLVTVPLAACGNGGESAVERGDRLLATGSGDAAIAEYKLALRQEGRTPEILLRLGHAYARRADVEEALQYLVPLMASDSSQRTAVAAELSEAARVALDAGSPSNMARALGPVLELGLGYVPQDLRLPLARYHAELSDWGRAAPLYVAAVEDGDVPPGALLETARAFQELGGCREALGWFERFLERAGRNERSAALWQYGTCLFEVATADRALGRHGQAEERLRTLIDQGVPRTLLDRAHYARGEIRLGRGELDAAERDFRAVLELNPVRSGPLVRLAEERIREIRYGIR
ncbi:MAG: tetratricopeptide repeat protein [Gemmatimonadota bacterium]